MLGTRGPGVQDNWDLWLNTFLFAYNTTMSSSKGVTPHYAMFGRKETLPEAPEIPRAEAEERVENEAGLWRYNRGMQNLSWRYQ